VVYICDDDALKKGLVASFWKRGPESSGWEKSLPNIMEGNGCVNA